MNIATLNAHARTILAHAKNLDQYEVRRLTVELLTRFTLEAGGADALELLDEALKVAKK